MRIAEYNPAIGMVYREMTDEEISSISSRDVSAEINELKQKLSDTDYIACKIAEGSASVSEYEKEIEQRKAWRQEINALEEVN